MEREPSLATNSFSYVCRKRVRRSLSPSKGSSLKMLSSWKHLASCVSSIGFTMHSSTIGNSCIAPAENPTQPPPPSQTTCCSAPAGDVRLVYRSRGSQSSRACLDLRASSFWKNEIASRVLTYESSSHFRYHLAAILYLDMTLNVTSHDLTGGYPSQGYSGSTIWFLILPSRSLFFRISYKYGGDSVR
jgi:hypothetical protein